MLTYESLRLKKNKLYINKKMNFISHFSSFINESFFKSGKNMSPEKIQDHQSFSDKMKEIEFDSTLNNGKTTLFIKRANYITDVPSSLSDREFSLVYSPFDIPGKITIKFSSTDRKELLSVEKLSQGACEDRDELIFLTRELLDYMAADTEIYQQINSGILEDALSKPAFFITEF